MEATQTYVYEWMDILPDFQYLYKWQFILHEWIVLLVYNL